MKNLKGISIIPLLLSIFFVQNLQAQWTEMEWERNNLKFEYPTNFTIIQNDTTTFTAKGDIFIMTIRALDDFEDGYNTCMNTLETIDCTDTVNVDASSLDYQHRLVGYEMYYTAKQKGKPMNMIIDGYQDELYGYNYSVQVLYWDDPKQNKVNYEAAIYILRSLALIDE